MKKDWKEVRIKDVCEIKGRIGYRGYTVDDLVEEGEGAITLSPSNMQNGKMFYDNCSYITWEKYHESPEIKVKVGDILFVKTGSTFGKSVRIDFLPMESTINPQICILSTNQSYKFIAYILQAEKISYLVDTCVIGGTIPTITQTKIGNFSFPLPPLATQHAIADYLDKKLAGIDRKISLLEQKRDRYTALRKSLINQVVRRGLNPDVELKNSGIPWLGKIPKHWEVKRVKDVTYIRKGKLLETVDEQLPGYKPLLSLDYLRNDTPQFENFVFTEDKELHVAENDIIVVWDGAGSGDILKGKEGILSSTIAKISMNKKIIQTKFFYFLRFNLEYKLKSQPTGMGIPHINSNVLKEFEIPIPPLPEQHAIADYLDKQSDKIDRIVENINAQLGKLAQLKKSLINECVTGEREVIAPEI